MSQNQQPNRWSLFELSATYYQDSDTNDIDDPGQELRVTAESNGVGQFLTLATRRWAVGDAAELQALLADFVGRGAGLPLATPAPAPEPEPYRPLADMMEPIATRRDYSQGLPEACSRTYLCDACGHDGGFAFDDCTQPECKGFYLAERPAMGPHQADEYGFGKPAGPYPVEAIDMDKVRAMVMPEVAVTAPEPEPAPVPVVASVAVVAAVAAVAAVPVKAKKAPKRKSKPNDWTPTQLATLRSLWPNHTAAHISGVIGRTEKGVKLKAYGLKLTKDPAAPIKETFLSDAAVAAVDKRVAAIVPVAAPANGLDQDAHQRISKAVRELGGLILGKVHPPEKARALGLLSRHKAHLHEVPGATSLYEDLMSEV